MMTSIRISFKILNLFMVNYFVYKFGLSAIYFFFYLKVNMYVVEKSQYELIYYIRLMMILYYFWVC